jgi:hypothetical protein
MSSGGDGGSGLLKGKSRSARHRAAFSKSFVTASRDAMPCTH